MKYKISRGSGGDGTEHMEEEINQWLEGDIKWQTSKTHVCALSKRCVILIIATIMLATPAWAASNDNAKTLGWAIGCGCLSADVDTVIKYLGDIYPNTSEKKLKTLAGYVKYGKKDSLLYDNSTSICSYICSNNKKTLNDLDDFIKFKESQ